MATPSLHLDFETRSLVELKSQGLWNYSHDASTDVWCLAWAFGDDEPSIWTPDPTDDDPRRVCDWVADGGRVVAHNAPFELAIWNNIMTPRYGWPELKPEQTYCTMAMAYAMGLPGALEDVALALGLKMLKDTEGRSLYRMALDYPSDVLTETVGQALPYGLTESAVETVAEWKFKPATMEGQPVPVYYMLTISFSIQ